MKKATLIYPYVWKGVLFGFLFPVLAVGICHFILLPDTAFSLRTLHRIFPLLWIIDTAPLVLGLISYAVGSRVVKLNSFLLEKISTVNAELVKKNALLQNVIGERDVLLKEIHHRVKNNLQVITSLLGLQSSFIESPESKALFRYCQYRINSIAIIHEMLYKSEDISNINYKTYTEKLASGLIESMKGTHHNIELELDIRQINLNIDTAIPLGLMINEIITNSLKYGMPAKDPGTINIKITKIKHHNYKMLIGDNGIGFTDEINFRNSNSLGLQLIHKLSIQLEGQIEKDNNIKGTNYILLFNEIYQS